MEMYVATNGNVIIDKLIITPDTISTTEDILQYVEEIGLDNIYNDHKHLEYYTIASLFRNEELGLKFLWDYNWIS